MPSTSEAQAQPAERSRAAIILGTGIFLVAYGTNVSTPFLVTYRERLELGDSATMAIFTVYVAGILLVLPIAGQMSDRFGRREVSVPFIFVSALASIIMIFGRDTLVFLLLGRFLLGTVSGAVLSIGAAWIQDLMGKGAEQRSAVLSTVLSYGGFGAGPLVSALILELDVWPLVFPYVLHAAATVAIIPFLFRVPQPDERSKEPLRPRIGVPPEGRDIFMKIVAPASIWVFAFPSTSFALFPVIVSDAIDGSKVVVAAVAGALTAWSALFSRPTLPRLGATRTLRLGMVIGTVGYTLGTTAFATDIWWLVLPAAVLLGGASGLLTAGSLALLASVADDKNRGAINGTFYLLAYPGMAMPIVLTGAASLIGLTPALILLTTIAALATARVLTQSPPESYVASPAHGRS